MTFTYFSSIVFLQATIWVVWHWRLENMSHRNDHQYRLADPMAHAAAGNVRSEPEAIEDWQYRGVLLFCGIFGTASLLFSIVGIVHQLNGSSAG